MFTGLLANTTAKDQALAQDWYTKAFGRDPDGNRIVFSGE